MIALLSAEGAATNAIMHETGQSKTRVWRWQERSTAEDFEGLLGDKTRPSGIKKLDPAFAQRVVALTMEPPLAEASHWRGAAMADAAARQRLFGAARAPMGFSPIACACRWLARGAVDEVEQGLRGTGDA